MGQAKHTPGPWDYDIILDICTESEDLSEGFKQGVAEANARLITAAPKLLEACIEARRCINHHGIVGDPVSFMLDAAIEKAEGG